MKVLVWKPNVVLLQSVTGSKMKARLKPMHLDDQSISLSFRPEIESRKAAGC